MTPQTAAALRALEHEAQQFHWVIGCLQSMQMEHGLCEPRSRKACTHCNAKDRLDGILASYKGPAVLASALRQIDDAKRTNPDELAAVLTQEGAEVSDYCRVSGCVHAQFGCPTWPAESNPFAPAEPQAVCNGHCEDCPDECERRIAPAEPRAAEGAGTGWKKNFDALRRAVFDTCTMADREKVQERYTFELQREEPTAAAAVSAGGDAVRLRGVIERDRRTFADCVEAMHRVINQHSWMVDSRGSYEWDDKRYQDEFGEALTNIRAEVEKLAARARDMSDSPSSEAELRAALAAPAPRGGVTEAMVDAGYEAYLRSENSRGWPSASCSPGAIRAALEAALSTPPAAQAQDAGPMARGK